MANSDPEGGAIWQALSDPTRRRILDLLRERPRITGDIASRFEISRIAVMRHLEVLSATGLVTSRKRGRERWHYLNAVPLERIYERWVEAHAGHWAAGLLHLRRSVQSTPARMSANRPVVDVALELSIAAPRAWTDDSHLELAGPFHMGVALGFATFELSDRDGATALQFSFRAIGAIDAGFRERAAEGWADLTGRLKTLVETGARLGIAPDPPHKEKKR
jgi:DNA-binding transcriptional ArsR family regulator